MILNDSILQLLFLCGCEKENDHLFIWVLLLGIL